MGNTNRHDVEIKRIEAEKQREEQQHQQRMKQAMINAKEKDRANKEKQRTDAVSQLRSHVSDLNKQIAQDQENLKLVLKEQETKKEQIKIKQDSIDRCDEKYITEQCQAEKRDVDDAQAKYKRSDDEILQAIAKTGQDEDNVGRFLRLTHALIAHTTTTQANVNKLDAELSTFQTLLQRVSQDKLSIDYYFKNQGLGRFVPILGKQGFTDCQHLVCSNEQEFKSHVLGYLNEEIEKDIEEWNKRHPNELDPFDVFLEKYKLKKFKAGLDEAGLTSLDDINEDLADEDIEELISEAGIKGLNKKKFKRAINDVLTGKYQPPELEKVAEEKKNDDDNKQTVVNDEKPREITLREKMTLENICFRNTKQWKDFEAQKTDSTRDSLLQMGPILGDFFGKTYGAVKSTQKLLECSNDDELNDKQIEAMNNMMDDDTKAIEPANGGLMDNKPTTDIRLNNGGPFDMKYMEGANWPFGTVSSASTQDTQESKLSFTIAGQYQYGDDDIISFAISLDDEGEILLSVIRGNYSEALDKLQAGPSRISGSSWEATIKTFKPGSDDAKYGVAIIIDAPKDSDNTAPDTEDNKEEDKIDPTLLHDYEQRKAWKEGSATQVYSESKNKWYNGEIIKVDSKNQREIEVKYDLGSHQRTKQVDRYGKEVRDRKAMEGRAIARRIQVDIDVVSGLMNEFQKNATTKRALPMALGVQGSVGAIMVSQSQMRQSVRLAGDILKLKPANLDDKSQPLWDAVDGGVLHILKSFLEMNKISAQYFGYFLRFNSSFQEFISMNAQNKEVSLLVSLEHVQQDITQFGEFREKFEIKLAELTGEATKVIQECVKKHIGEQQFETARQTKAKSKQEYLQKKKVYDQKMTTVLQKIENKRMEKANEQATLAELEFKQEKLEESIKRKQGYIKTYKQEETKLLEINFDAGF